MRRSSEYFQAIVTSQGRDVPLLMAALGELDKLYALIVAVLTLGASLSILGVVFAALGG